jgi:hypothetical protein
LSTYWKSGVKNRSFNYYFDFRIFECCLYLKTTWTTTSQLVHISLYIYWYSSVYDNRSLNYIQINIFHNLLRIFKKINKIFLYFNHLNSQIWFIFQLLFPSNVRAIVLSATLNNISVISWRQVYQLIDFCLLKNTIYLWNRWYIENGCWFSHFLPVNFLFCYWLWLINNKFDFSSFSFIKMTSKKRLK